MTPFFRIQLRTIDVDAARRFYTAVIGEQVVTTAVPLHEGAIARGAKPHWLGFLDVGEVDRASAGFTQRGATSYGPKWINPEGLEAAVMRDPGGAMVALAKPPGPTSPTGVSWHLLNTLDVERAKANYGELFGWEFKAPVDLGSLGLFHPFSYERGGPPVGSMAELRAGVHAHWLFHFAVPSLDAAVTAVKAGGGVVLGPFTLPGGERIAVCDDPQGAAFAIREPSV